MIALLLALAQTPAVTVEINHDRFDPGDKARVYVETAQDGYLVVLRADAAGRVRVLFPLDPTNDDFVRGGRRQELRGRNDREAFVVDDDDGTGTVLAALMSDPFTYDDFVRNDHWDYRALRGTSLRDDPLTGLLDIVQRMAGQNHFDYDDVTYVVRGRVATGYSDDYEYGYPYHLGIGVSYGYPFYSPFYDPFCYDPFWGFSRCYGYGFGFGYSYYRPRVYPYWFSRPFVRSGFGVGVGVGFTAVRHEPRFLPTQPRPRATFAGGVGGGGGLTVRDRQPAFRGFQPRSRGDSPRMQPRARTMQGGGPRAAPSGGGRSFSGGRASGGQSRMGGASRTGGGSRTGGASRGGGGGGRRH